MTSIRTGDFGNGPKGDLVIGTETEPVNGIEYAGAFTVLYGGDGDLGAEGGALVTQASAGVPGSPQKDAFFGWIPFAADFGKEAYADLAVSAYRADVGTHKEAGEVLVAYAGPDGLRVDHMHMYTEDTPGIKGVAERMDHFGFSLR